MTNVFLIEPNHFLREGLRVFLPETVCNLAAAIESVTQIGSLDQVALPDLLILGPGAVANVEHELGTLREKLPSAHELRSMMLMDIGDVPAVIRVAALGVDAVLSKAISGDVLLRSLELVMLGQQIFPSTAAQPHTASAPATAAAPSPVSVSDQRSLTLVDRLGDVILSEREAQTLRGLVDGASNKVIAQQMRVSEATIKAHVKSLLRKIRVTNRTQAALWGLSNRAAWTDPDVPLEHRRRTREFAVPVTAVGPDSLLPDSLLPDSLLIAPGAQRTL